MNLFLLNVLLAFAWMALTGTLTPSNFGVGFVLSFIILWLVRIPVGDRGYFGKLIQVCTFAAFFFWELTKANIRVAYDVLTPAHNMRPGVIAIPLDAETDAEITMLALIITLTPGTLSLDVSSDRRILYVHAMYIDDVDKVRREIKRGYERRVLEVLR